MTILWLTKPHQERVCSEIASVIETSSCSVEIYTETTMFFARLAFSKDEEIDFVMVDITLWQQDLFNPYLFIREKKLVPVVTYNDPYPREDQRAGYWIEKNISYFSPLIPEKKIRQLYPVLCVIQGQLRSPRFRTRVSAICVPEEWRDEDVSFEPDLSPSRKKLYSYFFKNREIILDDENLCRYMWNEFSAKKMRTLYSYISEIRSALEDAECPWMIERESKGRYCMRRKA